MKKFLLTSYILILGMTLVPCFAQSNGWGNYGNDPIQILDKVVQESNKDYKIQQTALDGATDKQGSYQAQYKIANTLDRLRNNIPISNERYTLDFLLQEFFLFTTDSLW